jgi:hypothetical protein
VRFFEYPALVIRNRLDWGTSCGARVPLSLERYFRQRLKGWLREREALYIANAEVFEDGKLPRRFDLFGILGGAGVVGGFEQVGDPPATKRPAPAMSV